MIQFALLPTRGPDALSCLCVGGGGLLCRYLYYSTVVDVATAGNVTLDVVVSCANAFSVFLDGEVVATSVDGSHTRWAPQCPTHTHTPGCLALLARG